MDKQLTDVALCGVMYHNPILVGEKIYIGIKVSNQCLMCSWLYIVDTLRPPAVYCRSS